MNPVNINTSVATLDEAWRPRIIGHFQDAKIQIAQFDGDFVWHQHDHSDDLFLVLEGRLDIDLPDGTVKMSPGDLFVVPAGVRHRPRALGRVHVLNLEAAGTVNTGDAVDPGELTAPEQPWLPS
jgi:mannose-6-phosphate isomerase-like protein (cupin superfamily)